MRISLAGDGEPIPLEALPDFEQGNTMSIVLPDGYIFTKEDFIALGYTHYEVMCVGGAGGRGGHIGAGSSEDFGLGAWSSVHEGGSGGGGGLEVVSGALVDLPDTCAVVVGAAGVDGANSQGGHGFYDPPFVNATPGTNGGASTFGGTICRASGGKGGAISLTVVTASANKAVRQVFVLTPDGSGSIGAGNGNWVMEVRSGGDGGQGGIGGRTAVGGGAEGGKSLPGLYSPFIGSTTGNTPQTFTDPETGGWDGHIGEGGGGGRGGAFAAYAPPYIMWGI